ncbi:MAG: hypothetical protein ACK4YM_10595, partial [Novosphingobium sp.]
MISDYLLLSATGLMAVTIVAAASLKGWQGWLQLKTRELELHQPEIERAASGGAARIEIADLKDRIRKLEAIA